MKARGAVVGDLKTEKAGKRTPFRHLRKNCTLVGRGPLERSLEPFRGSWGAFSALASWIILKPLEMTLGGLLVGSLRPLGEALGSSEGPLRSLLGPLGGAAGACGGLRAILGWRARNVTSGSPSWAHLGSVYCALRLVLGASWAILVPSWAVLRPSGESLGPPWGDLESLLGRLGRSSDRKGRIVKTRRKSRKHNRFRLPEAYWGFPGVPLEASWRPLGPS